MRPGLTEGGTAPECHLHAAGGPDTGSPCMGPCTPPQGSRPYGLVHAAPPCARGPLSPPCKGPRPCRRCPHVTACDPPQAPPPCGPFSPPQELGPGLEELYREVDLRQSIDGTLRPQIGGEGGGARWRRRGGGVSARGGGEQKRR